MTTRVIVLVADRNDPRHGEITIRDNTAEAERLVETLLEAGIEQDRIRVFAGGEMDAQVTHRPVVALVVDEVRGSTEARDGVPAEEEIEHEEAVPEAVAEVEAVPQGMAGAERDGPGGGSASMWSSLRKQAMGALPESIH